MGTEPLMNAFRYAAELHATQLRKGTSVPYIAHLMAVAAIVLEHGGNETQVVAALLHDAIEDQPRGGVTRQEIREQFGPEVLAIVEDCTDADTGAEAALARAKGALPRSLSLCLSRGQTRIAV
jgi:(p)ppGpp synthase/HD superfamily hydrolase